MGRPSEESQILQDLSSASACLLKYFFRSRRAQKTCVKTFRYLARVEICYAAIENRWSEERMRYSEPIGFTIDDGANKFHALRGKVLRITKTNDQEPSCRKTANWRYKQNRLAKLPAKKFRFADFVQQAL